MSSPLLYNTIVTVNTIRHYRINIAFDAEKGLWCAFWKHGDAWARDFEDAVRILVRDHGDPLIGLNNQ